MVLPPRIFHYEPKIHGFRLYKKTGSRAVGSKDVITYPKAFDSKAAANELKFDPSNDEENKRIVDEDAAMAPDEAPTPFEGKNVWDSNENINKNSKKGKKNKKGKGKNKN